jgi:hypothetical protein
MISSAGRAVAPDSGLICIRKNAAGGASLLRYAIRNMLVEA